jgi:hypothetical protein
VGRVAGGTERLAGRYLFRAIRLPFLAGVVSYSVHPTGKAMIDIKESSSGCWCLFVKISEGVGIKFYPSREMMLDSRTLQECGHEDNLAPACWGETTLEMNDEAYTLIEIPFRWTENYATVHGYFTEVADVDDSFDDSEELLDLLERMNDRGYYIFDVHYGNVGYDSKGTLVCIDWDVSFNLNNRHNYENEEILNFLRNSLDNARRA